ACDRAVVPGARSVLVAEPADPREPLPPDPRRCGLPADRRSTDLAVLRNVRGAGRQRSAARQFPGGSAAGDRASHVSYEHWSVAAGKPGRVRFRIRARGRGDRSDETVVRDDGTFGAVPGTLLQLVRHAHLGAPSPALCLDGGQRELGRVPHHARGRTPGAGGREDLPRRAGLLWPGGYARRDRRG